MDFAMAQLDWQHHVFNCRNQKVKYFKKLRSVFSVHNESPRLIVGKISLFKRWQDLNDKRVNIGNPSFGHHGTMEVLMAAHGDVCERVWSNQRVGLNGVWASPLIWLNRRLGLHIWRFECECFPGDERLRRPHSKFKW